MSLGSLSHLKRLFGGLSNEESKALFKETLLVVLSRASRADLVTDDSEVAKVQEVMKAQLGEDIPASDIRVASSSDLFEFGSIERSVSKVSPQLSPADRRAIAVALTEVIQADENVTETEVEFFNKVVNALGLTPAQLLGLEVRRTDRSSIDRG